MRFRFSRLAMLSTLFFLLAAFGMLSPAPAGAVCPASVSFGALGTAATENFDTLATSGTTNTTTPCGWYFAETGTNANTTYAAGDGTSNSGNTYSFGTGTNTDRAFGGLLSGSLVPTIGASFSNNTGSPVTQLVISYTGEQWRLGATPRAAPDQLQFQLSTDATSLTTGGWTSYSSLDFSSPITSGTVGKLDGNAAANRTAIVYTITGLNIPDGNTFWIKWLDFNVASSDDGLAVDDFSITPLSPPAPTNPTGVGAANPSSVIQGLNTNTLFTVAVTPGLNPTSTGLAVSCDLSAIGGAASQTFYDDGTNGDVTSGDNTFTFGGTVTAATTAGAKSLPCNITDAQARTGSASITITVLTIRTIGEVQGAVTDSTNGATFESPLKGQNVVVRGVVYEETIARTSTGSTQYGFFLQNTAATSDGDPNTSDGIFVFLSYGSTLAGYTPVVGDEIIIGAKVTEYFSFTELTSPFAFYGMVRSGVDIDAEVAPFVTNPPADLAVANRYWERRESMRAQVPIGSIVTNGRNTFASSADAETWVINPSNPLASRPNPYARRAFRDAHPLDDNYDPANWDGNGYRILMGSLGLKGASGNNTTMIAPSRAFDTLTNAPTGGLYYQFSKYTVMVAEQPTYNHGPDPSLNAPPSDLPRSQNYSIVTYNLENLYDYRDDPNDGCDFAGGANTGCAKDGQTVKPAYDYVPPSDAAYQERLTDIANQIIADLHAPDILLVQEAEDEDICSVAGSTLNCGTADNADGKPDTIQELALKIASLGGPAYDAAFDRDGSDARGIIVAFLYRTDRVELLTPSAGDPVLGSSPTIVYSSPAASYNSQVSNPKALNALKPSSYGSGVQWESTNVFSRAPQVALFRIHRTNLADAVHSDVYVVNDHFKSGPDSYVQQRTEQANYNAAIVKAIQAVNPKARIVVGGDLNVYPRPDDPFAPLTSASTSDQLRGLYNAGMKNLWQVLAAQVPEAAYSYTYIGMAQTLDQLFITPSLYADLTEFRAAHINADFPADNPGDGARGTSDHDPQVAHFLFNWATPGRVYGGGSISSPAGALIAKPLAKGRANFTLDVKYNPTTKTAAGPIKFVLSFTTWNFAANSIKSFYRSSNTATIMGSGKVNGAGDFRFLITAYDSGLRDGTNTDKLRIKIWNNATGKVVYDNQKGTVDDSPPTRTLLSGNLIIAN